MGGPGDRRDLSLLYGTAFLRATATGLAGVQLGMYLSRLGLTTSSIGTIVSAGLAGAAVASLLVTLGADRRGRRRVLVELAVLGAAGTLLLATASHPAALGLAAFVGMVNGMGRDRGASLILEQAAIPSTVDDAGRTRALAIYNVAQDAGHAVGALLAGLPEILATGAGLEPLLAHRAGIGLCGALLLGSGALYLGVSARIEAPAATSRRVSPGSRRRLSQITALFALDSLGGGFLTTALLSFFFFERFGVGEGTVATLFFGARVLNAVSHLAAARLARRIGLVNTMVFTHLPSSLLLVTVAIVPSFPVAAALFLLREGLVEMDVPTRQSFVLAVVRPEERTFASGVTHLVRMAAWAIAPLFAGVLMERYALGVPLAVGAGMKIAYDLLLWRAFRRVRPPEEE